MNIEYKLTVTHLMVSTGACIIILLLVRHLLVYDLYFILEC